MAPRINFDVKPTKIGPNAHEELERLLQTLHQHGVLRLANDVVAANVPLAMVLVKALSKPGTVDAIENLSILLMALSRITPPRFYKLVFALRDAVDGLCANTGEEEDGEAPGISGAYRMLHDEELWHALKPLITGLKIFAERLGEEAERPVSAFTGKKVAEG